MDNKQVINIKDYPQVLNLINEALNGGKVIEVKNESHTAKPNITVVEIKRKMLTKKEQ